jgi:hypothetical protein
MMMLWNLLLTAVVGIIGYIVKDKFDDFNVSLFYLIELVKKLLVKMLLKLN